MNTKVSGHFQFSHLIKLLLKTFGKPICKTFSLLQFVSACKNQLFTSIHSWDAVVFRVQLPNKMPHPFWPQPPKNIKVTFSSPEFVSTHHKSVYSINSLLRHSQF